MKIAAFGDCHVGSYGTTIDEKSGLNARLLDTASSVRFVIEDCYQHHVYRALFVGDMYRELIPRPTPTQIMLIRSILEDYPLQIEAIPGNHDHPRGTGENNALEPLSGERFRVHSYPAILTTYLDDVQIATLPYPNRAQMAASIDGFNQMSPDEADRAVEAGVSAILQDLAARLDPSKPSILMAHLSISSAEAGGYVMNGRDIAIPLSAIPEAFTFAVFGHIHKAQDFASYGRPNVLYTGSTDRISFNEEGEEKSYVVMDTDAGIWERVPIPCRRYKTFSIQMGESIVCDRNDIADFDDGRDAIVRFKITRPENVKPDYVGLEVLAKDMMHCFDYRGVEEEVERVTSVRSEEVTNATTIAQHLGIWHKSSTCDVPLEDLQSASADLEKAVL